MFTSTFYYYNVIISRFDGHKFLPRNTKEKSTTFMRMVDDIKGKEMV